MQANQLGKIDNPSSSGFFTPDTELGPFSLDQISAPDQRFNLGVGDTLHLEKSSSNQPLETRLENLYETFNSNFSTYFIKTLKSSSFSAVNYQPPHFMEFYAAFNTHSPFLPFL